MELFRKKTVEKNLNMSMRRELKTKDLIFLGIGAIIGTGIFVVTGTAAEQMAGPALALSFVLAALVVILSGLCFAEFSSRVPVTGGPYAYMYVVFGELIAWMTGWMMLWEFLLAVSSVASGWASYLRGFLDSIGLHIPTALSGAYDPAAGTYFDVVAFLVVILVTYWVSLEAKTALRLNNLMVYVKFGVIILFIVVGAFFVKTDNWTPFMPMGIHGVFDGAALVLFAFLGFDAVAMAADEVKDPQRDVPRGIIGSIILATIFYIIVTLILTGMVPYNELGVGDPVAFAMRFISYPQIGGIISVGAIVTLLTVTISMMYSLARLLYAISKDGLLPQVLSKIDEKRRTPKNATYVAGVVSMFFAGIFPLGTLAQLTNIVALGYFVIMAVGILKLRRTFGQPQTGEFKMPWVPLLPLLSAAACAFMMLRLSKVTWIVFAIVMLLGVVIYFGYGYQNSKLKQKNNE